MTGIVECHRALLQRQIRQSAVLWFQLKTENRRLKALQLHLVSQLFVDSYPTILVLKRHSFENRTLFDRTTKTTAIQSGVAFLFNKTEGNFNKKLRNMMYP